MKQLSSMPVITFDSPAFWQVFNWSPRAVYYTPGLRGTVQVMPMNLILWISGPDSSVSSLSYYPELYIGQYISTFFGRVKIVTFLVQRTFFLMANFVTFKFLYHLKLYFKRSRHKHQNIIIIVISYCTCSIKNVPPAILSLLFKRFFLCTISNSSVPELSEFLLASKKSSGWFVVDVPWVPPGLNLGLSE